MIFAHTLEQVIHREKTQTRRLVKPGQCLDSATGRIHNHERTLYQIGKSYAVQPNRGQKSVARIRLTGLRHATVNAITDEDARAEGFASRADFLAIWKHIHGAQTDLDAEVWVLEFELIAILADEYPG